MPRPVLRQRFQQMSDVTQLAMDYLERQVEANALRTALSAFHYVGVIDDMAGCSLKAPWT